MMGGFAGGLISPPAQADIPRVAKIRTRAQPRIEHTFTAKGLSYPARRYAARGPRSTVAGAAAIYEYFETHRRVPRASIDAKSGVYTRIEAPAS